jgi:potassium-transporting ATPase KdpC subunit
VKTTKVGLRNEIRERAGPAFRLAIISLALCGLVFPFVVTGFAQVLFPSQANGSLVQVHGRTVGSNLIAQEFKSPIFFHPRNASSSASGVDPDITISDAYSQIWRISQATGLSTETLSQMVNQNEEGTLWIFGTPYVNVLRLNLALINTGNSAYGAFE